MAQSLRCAGCGLQLRSVKEAQAHNEATGHTNFEESTEAVLNIVCTECGKPCRSQVEQDLHSKRTGHSQFVDKTGEAAQEINTEVEMKEAAEDIKAEAMELLGGSAAAAAAAGGSSGEGADGAGTSQEGEQEEKVEPEVSEDFVKEMQEMGFGRNRCVRALYATDNASLEAAVNWVAEHDEDANIDEPLLVPKSKARKLTPEEAKAKAAELLRVAKVKREAAERELERVREKERIRMGKELAAAARLEEDMKLKRMVEARQREKEEEARAREKIRIKLEEDRKARRRRLGLPEELTEEEKEAERQKAAEKAAREAARKLPVKPVSVAEKLRPILVDIKKRYPGQDERVSTCYTTILKLVGNVAKAPGEEKFRKVKLTNPAIQAKVASLEGSVPFLEAVGFALQPSGEMLELPEDKVDLAVLNAAGAELHNALTNPFFGKL